MRDISRMMSGYKTMTLDPADWHPYNPNAERDAREHAEGVNGDPVPEFVKSDGDRDEPKIETVSPDFDLWFNESNTEKD